MRGCFQDRRRSEQRFHVLPAYAGMFLELSCFFSFGICSPRVCGDVSLTGAHEDTAAVFSPRMRGCFCYPSTGQVLRRVLPAYAGMFLAQSCRILWATSSPRVCGDVSMCILRWDPPDEFSPRMRGCFQIAKLGITQEEVLPAYAGMFLESSSASPDKTGSPRVCGDVSRAVRLRCAAAAFSPRMRGCFRMISDLQPGEVVLPAYAGMFLSIKIYVLTIDGSPRVCGDVSRTIQNRNCRRWFSPRMRGCFQKKPPPSEVSMVLPAYAGMFLSLKAGDKTI